jgi:hypothetical protein
MHLIARSRTREGATTLTNVPHTKQNPDPDIWTSIIRHDGRTG